MIRSIFSGSVRPHSRDCEQKLEWPAQGWSRRRRRRMSWDPLAPGQPNLVQSRRETRSAGGCHIGVVHRNVVESVSQPDVLGSLLRGLLHPLATPADVIGLAGFALIAGRRKRNAIEVAFALGLAIGLGALVRGVTETPAGDVLLAGAMLCGLLAASSVTVPAALAAIMGFLFGAALGLDSLPAAGSPGETVATLIGTACGGVVALALMASVAFWMARLWRGGLRMAGSLIAVIAILALVVRWGGLM
jgi:hypothetical protein